MQPIINHYSDYIKNKFGQRVQKITVHGTLNCPNRDGSIGYGGCTFCNNETFSAPNNLQQQSITDQITHGIKKSKFRYKNVNKYIIYFQSYTNTYGDPKTIISMFEEAISFPNVVGLSIGTRPDCLQEEILDYLSIKAQKYEISIELGLESFSDDTLKRINRRHDVRCFENALELCKKHNIKTCAHLILGFPWEQSEQAMKSGILLSKLPIDFLKLHQLHIVKNTVMAQQYELEKFNIVTKDQYIKQVIELLAYLDPKIIIQRLCGDAPKDLLIEPLWSLDMSNFSQQIENQMVLSGIYQGIKYQN